MATSLPAGRLVALPRGESGESLSLRPGPLDATLTVADLPLRDLPSGARLRVGRAALLELTAAGRGGLREAPDAEPCPAHVVEGGLVRVGDPVVLEAVVVPVEDALDLHPFRPDEIAAVVGEYLRHARAAGLEEVRLVHGRGRGVQRETVRRVLAASPLVATFADAPPERGGWGATVARLVPLPAVPPPARS
jgi:hypothetical protein